MILSDSFFFFQYLQDQTRSPQQQQLYPEVWPVVWPEIPNTTPGESGHLNKPLNTSDVEVQMALQQLNPV